MAGGTVTHIDLVTGFLGSGKTTLLNKLLPSLKRQGKIALVENDFGEQSIDAQLLQQDGLDITELSAGCICCSLQGDLVALLRRLVQDYRPWRILIEPSGVGRTTDVLRAVGALQKLGLAQRGCILNLVDCNNFGEYSETFGEFFSDQIANADCNLLSHWRDEATRQAVASSLEESGAACFAGDWLAMEGDMLCDFLYSQVTAVGKVDPEPEEHHHTHSAGEIFSSWSTDSARAMSRHELEQALQILAGVSCGRILRAKGIIPTAEGNGCWHFDYLPGHRSTEMMESGGKQVLVTVIGEEIDREKLGKLFEQTKEINLQT